MLGGRLVERAHGPSSTRENFKLLAPFVSDTIQRIMEEHVLLPSSSSSEVEVNVAEAE